MNFIGNIFIIIMVTIGICISIKTLDNYIIYDKVFINLEWQDNKIMEIDLKTNKKG